MHLTMKSEKATLRSIRSISGSSFQINFSPKLLKI